MSCVGLSAAAPAADRSQLAAANSGEPLRLSTMLGDAARYASSLIESQSLAIRLVGEAVDIGQNLSVRVHDFVSGV